MANRTLSLKVRATINRFSMENSLQFVPSVHWIKLIKKAKLEKLLQKEGRFKTFLFLRKNYRILWLLVLWI